MSIKYEDELCKTRITFVLSTHIGRNHKIGMGELFELVFIETYENRINDTRRLRSLVTALRSDGIPICSDSGGYWLAASASELKEYCDALQKAALKKLKQVSILRKIGMKELIGQMGLFNG